MLLQAFVDDSGSDQESATFVLAGFVASYEKWGQFTNEWQAALDKPPKLDFFKMAEANSLLGQFHKSKGWNDDLRDERISEFVSIIQRFAALRISVSVTNEHFIRYIKSLPTPGRNLSTDSPYTLLMVNLVPMYAIYASLHKFAGPCDFVFDEQLGFSEEILGWWDHLYWPETPSNLKSFIGSRPIWRDEVSFLPLQAADLYAWQTRRHQDENKRLFMPMRRPLRRLMDIPFISHQFHEAEVIQLRRQLIYMSECFKQANPNVPMVDALNNPLARKKERKRRKSVQATYKPFKL